MFFWNCCLGQKVNARVLLKSGIDESQLLFKLCKCFITWKIACVYVCACIYMHVCTHHCICAAVFTWRSRAQSLNNSYLLSFLRGHVYRETDEMHFKKCAWSSNFIKSLFKKRLFRGGMVWNILCSNNIVCLQLGEKNKQNQA